MRHMTHALLIGVALVALSGCARNRAPAELPPVEDSSYGNGGDTTGGVTAGRN